MSTSRGPGQRAGLDTLQVLAAARAVLREDGVQALSLRAVARRLGVAPNTLYSHVAGKDDLLDLVLDDVLGGVVVPGEEEVRRDPWGAVRAIMLDSYDVLLAHPALVPAYLDRQGARGVQARRLGVVTMRALGNAGLDEESAREAMRVLIVNTVGFAAFSARPEGAGAGVIRADELRRNFENGLGWLLAGIGS
ncbi:MAG TPA: helix-turn-helix domain-containing protein [Ornithinibacter sp.]|nr:helix-turn-helix domain-containing protein [Ornithinibacter sp.]